MRNFLLNCKVNQLLCNTEVPNMRMLFFKWILTVVNNIVVSRSIDLVASLLVYLTTHVTSNLNLACSYFIYITKYSILILALHTFNTICRAFTIYIDSKGSNNYYDFSLKMIHPPKRMNNKPLI